MKEPKKLLCTVYKDMLSLYVKTEIIDQAVDSSCSRQGLPITITCHKTLLMLQRQLLHLTTQYN